MISNIQREALAELCELSPDVRLGQLLAHLGFLGEDQTSRTLWDIDDEQLLAVLYHHRSELVGRTSDSLGESLHLVSEHAPVSSTANSTSPAGN